MSPPRILAVSHDFQVAGAQTNLLHFLGWLTANTDVEIHTLSLGNGPLRSRFEAISPVTVLNEHTWNHRMTDLQDGLERLGAAKVYDALARAAALPRTRQLRDFDLVYLGTPSSAGVLNVLPHDGPVICQVAELRTSLDELWPPSTRTAFATRPNRWIARSAAVYDDLVNRLAIPADRVTLEPAFIDVDALSRRVVSRRAIERRRRELRLPEDASIVMGAGALKWQKGPHLFVQLAAEVNRQHREQVHFVWVGGHHEDINWDRLAADIKRANIDRVHFVGEKQDPIPWFAIADVFALTSHEDGAPLTCLEHAAMGHAVVTFDNGGAPDLLNAAGDEAANGVIEPLDVTSMSRRIVELLGDVAQRDRVGRALQETVTDLHSVESRGEQSWETVRSVLAEN